MHQPPTTKTNACKQTHKHAQTKQDHKQKQYKCTNQLKKKAYKHNKRTNKNKCCANYYARKQINQKAKTPKRAQTKQAHKQNKCTTTVKKNRTQAKQAHKKKELQNQKEKNPQTNQPKRKQTYKKASTQHSTAQHITQNKANKID